MSRQHRFRRAPLLLLCLSLFFHGSARPQEEVSLYDYALTDLQGKEVRLSPYKGKILVVDFFATWCSPCRKDLPEVAAIQDDYPSDQVAVLAISADGVSKSVEKLPGFIKELGLKIPVFVGGGIFVDRFAGVEERSGRQITLPQTYIFSRDGEILFRQVGDQKFKKKSLSQELDRILKEGSPPETTP